MKNKTFVVALFGAAMTADMALAATTCNVVTCSQSAINEYNTNMQRTHATATQPLCVQESGTLNTSMMIFPKDSACKSMYTLVSGTDSIDTSYATALNNCTNKATILAQIGACEIDCSDKYRSTWDCNETSYNITGGKVDVKATLVKTNFETCTCNFAITTTCNSMYYGNRTNASQPGTCTQCPYMTGADAVGITTGTAATVITHCHIPRDNTINDGTGNFLFTQDCYYTK